MSQEYKEALERIANGEPGPRAIAEEALENSNGSASGAAESYPAPQWREEPPEESGYYWMKERHPGPDREYYQPEIVYVYDDQHGLKVGDPYGGDPPTWRDALWAEVPTPTHSDEAESAV